MFDEAAVVARVAATRFARVRYVIETASTNDDAARELGSQAGHGSVLVAEHQTGGHGRRGRRWVSAPGSGLLFTVTLPEPIAASSLWAVPFWCALAVQEGAGRSSGALLDLQWPNDLLLGGRKVCGILSTSRVAGELAWVACGIGINVRRPSADSSEVDPHAAYLSDIAPSVVREDVLVAILRALDDAFGLLSDTSAVARAWEERARLRGTPYRILVDGDAEPFDARAVRLGVDGRLVVDVQGRERAISLADARVVR
jgi:BirA family biotin operon repressor/biotin-[acetyl-CoA-carboxylase] ligase